LKSLAELSQRLDWLRAVRGMALFALVVLCAAPAALRAADADSSANDSLDRFRRSLWAEPIYLEFDLRQMPRRGDEHVYHGRLWGARNDQGPVTRLEIDVGAGGFSRHVLIQSGPEPAVWVSEAAGAGRRDDHAALVPGLEFTPFDVQMPYLYWLDVTVAGTDRIRGRPAINFVFTPPADFAAANPGVRAVRAYLDAQYGALVQSEVTGRDGNLAKTLSLLELRKVGDRWIPKDVDVRNEATRDKTRLSVTAVSTGIAVDPAAFDPEQLGNPLSPPPLERIKRVNSAP
jgi:hypothetical protein